MATRIFITHTQEQMTVRFLLQQPGQHWFTVERRNRVTTVDVMNTDTADRVRAQVETWKRVGIQDADDEFFVFRAGDIYVERIPEYEFLVRVYWRRNSQKDSAQYSIPMLNLPQLENLPAPAEWTTEAYGELWALLNESGRITREMLEKRGR